MNRNHTGIYASDLMFLRIEGTKIMANTMNNFVFFSFIYLHI